MPVNNGDRLGEKKLPFDIQNPAHLEAFYAGHGSSYCEHWRKVILSNCEEIVRARYTLAGEKISEDRIDCLAHLHDNYLDFLTETFEGRKSREQNVIDSRQGA